MTNSPVVIAFDSSQHSENALAWAEHTARLTGAPLLVVVADPFSSADIPEGLDSDQQPMEAVKAQAESLLEGVAAARVEIRPGDPVPVLLEASHDAAMLAVGSRGLGQFSGGLMGSVSQHLARHASCPVVVVRPTAHPAPSRIVVGVDASGGSAAALDFACARAKLTGEPVAAVHGWRLSHVSQDAHGNMSPKLVTKLAEHERLLAESVAALAVKYPDVQIETASVPVVAGQSLADQSMTASLLVVGSRGRGAFEGMLLGSVSQEVLQKAHCPVAIVR